MPPLRPEWALPCEAVSLFRRTTTPVGPGLSGVGPTVVHMFDDLDPTHEHAAIRSRRALARVTGVVREGVDVGAAVSHGGRLRPVGSADDADGLVDEDPRPVLGSEDDVGAEAAADPPER